MGAALIGNKFPIKKLACACILNNDTCTYLEYLHIVITIKYNTFTYIHILKSKLQIV
jgi:hypothetical protein